MKDLMHQYRVVSKQGVWLVPETGAESYEVAVIDLRFHRDEWPDREFLLQTRQASGWETVEWEAA